MRNLIDLYYSFLISSFKPTGTFTYHFRTRKSWHTFLYLLDVKLDIFRFVKFLLILWNIKDFSLLTSNRVCRYVNCTVNLFAQFDLQDEAITNRSSYRHETEFVTKPHSGKLYHACECFLITRVFSLINHLFRSQSTQVR